METIFRSIFDTLVDTQKNYVSMKESFLLREYGSGAKVGDYAKRLDNLHKRTLHSLHL